MLTRSVNTGFSGGEKKRNEILQMAVLEPKLAILDETDSGLDIDALRIVADGVNKLQASGQRDDRRHALSAAAQLHRARLRARAGGRADREDRAARSSRSSSRRKGYDWVTAKRRSRDVESYLRGFEPHLGDRRGPTRARRGCAVASGCARDRRGSRRSASRRRGTRTGTSPASRRSPRRSSTARARRRGDVTADELAPFPFGATDWPTLVFVNGRFDARALDASTGCPTA